jgi:hypothetical protein
VVWAKQGAAAKRDNAPARAPMWCFTDSSLAAVSVCPTYDHMLTPAFRAVKSLRRPRREWDVARRK